MNDQAPFGKKWYCMMCGKTALTLSSEQRGWDESCAMNAIAIDLLSTGPSHEQVFEFGKARDAALARSLASLNSLTEQIKRRELPDMSPELRALAERAAAALTSKEPHR